ncbi:MAG: signal peptide peptidase SppA [Anaerolineae bacterium]
MAERIWISDLLRNAVLLFTNRLRLLRSRKLDYIVLHMSGTYPERTVQRPRRFPLSLLPWPSPPPSVDSFATSLERIAHDPRVKGAVLIMSDLAAGPATVGSLRAAILRLRQAGKRCVAYMHDLGTWTYYLASACDEILAPESTTFRATGLWSEAVFLKDTLALVGLEADFEAIAEYKVSPDTMRRSKMTDPHREMLESLLDSLYNEITATVAQGRDMSEEVVRSLFDEAPMTASQASDAGLIDDVCYEDEVPHRLGTQEEPATLAAWSAARRRLVQPRRWRSRRAIGVISVVGTIVQGSSQRSPIPVPIPLPLPPAQAGSDTLVQQLRAAARDKAIAAVILHVDSPGGSAMASDLIWREAANLREKKPLVVYMSNRAASGGYYVSAPASEIFAQPTTLTGSIGIWGGKLIAAGLYDKLEIGRESVSRGRAAGMYADAVPFSDEERAKLRANIGIGYARFKDRVARGRSLLEDEVEAIARGRVWTGEQALKRGLVDALGDLHDAAERARQLAEVSPKRYAPLVDVTAPKHTHLAQASPAEVGAWLDGLGSMLREGIYALAPWNIQIRD